MRYLPHSKLAILTCCEEYILQFVVMDEAYFIREGRLKHQDALTTFFNVSYAHQALLCALTVAWHAWKPLESAQTVLSVSFVAIYSLNYSWFDNTSIDELDDRDYAGFGAAEQNIAIGVQVHVLDVVVLLWEATQPHRVDHHGWTRLFDVEYENHAFSCGDVESLKVRINCKIDRPRIRCLDHAGSLLCLKILAMDDAILARGVKKPSMLINYHRFDAAVNLSARVGHQLEFFQPSAALWLWQRVSSRSFRFFNDLGKAAIFNIKLGRIARWLYVVSLGQCVTLFV